MAPPSESDAPGPEKKLTAAEIARDWDCSRAYVSRCINEKGCPTTSLEAAREWRQANARYGVGYRSKKAAKTAAAAAPSEEKKAESPVGTRDLSTLDESLRAAIEVEQEAHRLVVAAQQQKNDAILAVRIAAYNKARAGRFETETAHREELERQRVLVPMSEAKALGRKGYDVMVPLLRALSKNAGPLCNPTDPLRATKILEQQVEAIIAQAAKEYDT